MGSQSAGTGSGSRKGPSGNGKLRPGAIIFDYGNVLSLPQQPSDVVELAAVAGATPDQFQQLYWKFRMPYDSAELTASTYWNTVARELGMSFGVDQISQLVEIDARSWSRPNEDTLRWVADLRRSGISLAVLSNMPLEIKDYLLRKCDWLKVFQDFVFSCDVGSVKPAPAIYQKCLSDLNCAAGEAVFLDDRHENVDGARELGIHAFLFDSVEQTSARVAEKFDLPVFSASREG